MHRNCSAAKKDSEAVGGGHFNNREAAMDQESIVYGCIKDIAPGLGESERVRVNREAMLALPRADEWPFLSQEMFSIPSVEATLQIDVGVDDPGAPQAASVNGGGK